MTALTGSPAGRSALEGSVALRTPRQLIRFSLVCAGVVVAVLLLLCFGKFTRYQSAMGQLTTDRGVARIQAREAAVLATVQVNEGDLVRPGQILATLSRGARLFDERDVDRARLQQANDGLRLLQSRRSNAERLAAADRTRLEARRQTLQSRLAQTRDLLELHDRHHRLELDRLAALERLGERSLLAPSHLEDQRRAVLKADMQVQATRIERERVEGDLRDLGLEIEQLPLDLASNLGSLDMQIGDQQQKILDAADRDTQVLTAPMAGRVSGLQAKAGESIRANAVLMTVVPEDANLHAVLFVPSRAIAFIRPAQSVSIRYQAFPYQRYGIQHGRIEQISQTILPAQDILANMPIGNEPVYRVTVALQSQEVSLGGKHYPLQGGMLLDADVALDRRALWQWFLDPILALRGKL